MGVMGFKLQWELRKKKSEELDRTTKETITPEDRQKEEDQAASARQTYDTTNRTVNLNKKRVTDIKEN